MDTRFDPAAPRALRLRRNPDYPGVAVGYALPRAALRGHISAISSIVLEPAAGTVEDVIYPEWPALRFAIGGQMALSCGPGPLIACPRAGGIGPTGHATRFSLTPGQYWTVGLTPLGWAHFVGARAQVHADSWQVMDEDSLFAPFLPLAAALEAAGDDGAVALIEDHFARLLDPPHRDAERIVTVHAALVDPAITTVGDLADASGLALRTLERLAASAFGFTPRRLLQRQRFLRSLSLFMLDPTIEWVATLDSYVDQAHFIRDFRRFMGMTPGQYAARPHPVLWAAAAARKEAAGAPMQLLQPPAT